MQELRFILGSLRLTPRNTGREIGITVIIAFLLLMPPLCRGWQKPMSLQLTTPVLSVNPTLGPPTTTVSVVGTGFDPNSRVEIYFDATVVASAMTDSTGHLVGGSVGGQVSIKVPASAVPGRHWISAIEPLGQKMGRAPFLVRTDWAQFRFAPDHAGANSYENVLTQETVGGLQQRWTYTTSAGIQSSPAVVGGTAYFGSDDGAIYAVQISTGRLLGSMKREAQLIPPRR